MERILVIEDSTVVQAQLEDILSPEYRLVLCDDGPSGMAAAQEEPPGLILLDVYLPGIDGYEICRRLKEDERTRQVPVIFITSLGAEREKVRGFEAGADDYIVKPFYAGELRARVALHLASRREKRLAVEIERLKLLREMAVALSHELNNPLTSLFGLLHLAGREAPDDRPRLRQHLAEIRGELEKVRFIVEKLATASRVAKTDYLLGEEMLDLREI
ncbi:ATP-binding response regulator [Geobacter pickeringii]|uniref:histidine kinase n=1 Tax=Geobacter pickeringii TaxID=345632 RepID=A0A0B5BF60_9BACT|nr:response regulator [Geobacter pickeringii]AJE02711.1 histidine kinase [Geobacter pickeringii]